MLPARRPHPVARSLALLGAAALLGCPGPRTPDGGADAPAPTDALPDAPAFDAPDAALDATDAAPSDAAASDAAPDTPSDAPARLAIETIDTRFVTREHMIASLEMQQSGEPLAESFGRNLGGYDRTLTTPDLYVDPDHPDAGPTRDLVGYASAIESYEYSKVPMNGLAFETGAGLSLAFGPLVNPSGATGTAALGLLRDRVQQYALRSHVGVRGSTAPNAYVRVPAPTDDPNNTLGWRGLWPTLHPFDSFATTLAPVSGVTGNCSITPGDGDDGRAGAALHPVCDYECNYASLHLPMRSAQVSGVISPGASGWAAWKYALWITNYLQIMHDVAGNVIAAVPPGDLAAVGAEANTVVGTTDNPVGPSGPGMPGTYLGSSDIEGFQGALMIDALDNAALQWLTALGTTDGASLSGFASVSAALAYDYTAPLRWIPARVRVTEDPADASGFPRPTTYAVASSDSHLLDLLGLLGAYAQLYALTDHANPDAGGAQPARAYFDGDPFPDDDQAPDGEASLHDRSLALLKFALVALDRVHREPASGVFVDDVTFAGATPTRGTTLATSSAAYTLVALRAVRRGISSNLTLYSNSRPDTAVTTTALDATSFAGAPGGDTVAQRITHLLEAHADLLYAHLTDADGNAFAGWDTARAAPTATAPTLEGHAAAVRGLLEAFLATGQTRYRDRAEAVFARMEALFYDGALRVYRSAPLPDGAIAFTPLRFALVQSALRELYKLVGSRPGRDALASQLEDRIARLDKLVLNGWDDRNGDGQVDWPAECVRVIDGLPRGGLQMGERALTGELGLLGRIPQSDRDRDCVPEISYAHLPAALAAEGRFTGAR